MEIERKWLFDSVIAPEGYPILKKKIYSQGYISIEPEFRIRRSRYEEETVDTHKLCIKSKGTKANGLLARIEIEKPLTKEEFEQLLIVGNMQDEDLVVKNPMYIYEVDGQELALCIVDADKDSTFIYGEIEFLSTEDADSFIAPSWFGKEVTHDPYYKMANYWKRTRNNQA